VELTETAALNDFEESARFISSLRELGCRVAIDDFGAGYTSFRNLKMLRVDMVKIDGTYIRGLSGSPDNQVFVRTLVDLAKNFNLETVAEWVGSDEDAHLLEKFGVDYFQGFHVGEPQLEPEWMTG
jgi:EAL domain-containing protein (putative c-di-GMP-specific phosphodiesterase class I)